MYAYYAHANIVTHVTCQSPRAVLRLSHYYTTHDNKPLDIYEFCGK